MNILELSAIIDAGILAECSRIDTKRRLTVEPATFGRARLGIGPKPPVIIEGVYDDMWDFPNWHSALQALETWDPQQVDEPDGWHRHYGTVRYRINGDKNLEYVRSDGTVEDQIKWALAVTLKDDVNAKNIKKLERYDDILDASFPQYTRCYHVVVAVGNPRYLWDGKVYHYIDHSVVVGNNESATVTVDNIIQRLTGN